MGDGGESDAMAEEMMDEQQSESVEDSGDSGAGYSEESFEGEVGDVTDRHGRGFDPELHRTDSDGNPRVTSNGNLITKPGKKPEDLEGSDPDHDPKMMEKYRSTAEVEVESIITIACMVGDREVWQAPTEEKENLKDAMVEYHKARGIVDMPPEVALLVAWGGYVSKRFSMKQLQDVSWFQLMQIRILEAWVYWFGSQERYDQLRDAREQIKDAK